MSQIDEMRLLTISGIFLTQGQLQPLEKSNSLTDSKYFLRPLYFMMR